MASQVGPWVEDTGGSETTCHISSRGLKLWVSGDVDRVATLWLWAADVRLGRGT